MKQISNSAYLYIFIALSLLVSMRSASACENCYGFLYGQNHLYALQAPPGWELDNQVGRSRGIQAMFYKKGEGIAPQYSYMYTNVSQIGKEVRTVEDLVKITEREFHQQNAELNRNLKVSHLKDETINGKLFKIYKWQYGNRQEAVAYVKEEYVIVMMILTAPTKASYTASYQNFKELLKSYRFMSSDVIYRSVAKQQFEQVKSYYDEQMKKPEARVYVDELNRQYLSRLAELESQCRSETSTVEQFELMISINKIGIPMTIYWTPSKIADCMEAKGLAEIRYPRLPEHFRVIHWYNRFLDLK